jgi:hypothetical protein
MAVDWQRILSYDARARHALIAQEIAKVLNTLDHERITTRDLCERLWPLAEAQGLEAAAARTKKFPTEVLRSRTNLPGWWERGDGETRNGKWVYPVLWRRGATPPEPPAKVSTAVRLTDRIAALETRIARLEERLTCLTKDA